LAHTYGRVIREDGQQASKGTAAKGKKKDRYYGTIWKKGADSKWKVVVSVGLLRLKDLPQNEPDKKYGVDPTKADRVTQEVINTELAFSRHAGKKGTSHAFYSFLADDGVAVSLGGSLSNKEFYKRRVAKAKAEGKTGKPRDILAWKPFYSFVSASGDLAYNYGPFTLTWLNSEGKEMVNHGYFITVWKRQADGSWKFRFDGGNSCPPPVK
ncbi:MAG: nuclear transport factor 2 family protein, partial [bacterium]|nr:nuclear transport factor 2 family protein [bacterium]